MACNITVSGRSFPCKDKIGGIKRVWIKSIRRGDWGTVSNGAISDAASAITVYGFEIDKEHGFVSTNRYIFR